MNIEETGIKEGCSLCSDSIEEPRTYSVEDHYNLNWYSQIIHDYKNYILELELNKWGFHWSETVEILQDLERLQSNKVKESLKFQNKNQKVTPILYEDL